MASRNDVARPVPIPIGITRWANVRLVKTAPGVLAWKVARGRRRRIRQPRIVSLRQLRAYVRSVVQTAPEVTAARLLLGMAEIGAVAVVGRAILSRAAAATESAVAQAERTASREVLKRVADSARRAASRKAGRLPADVPSPWRLPPAGSGRPGLPTRLPGVALAPPGIPEYMELLADQGADGDGLREILVGAGEALDRFDELVDLALDVLLFPVVGIADDTALRLLHPAPFFEATREVEIDSPSTPPPPTPRLDLRDAGDGGNRLSPPRRPARTAARDPDIAAGTPKTDEEQLLEEDVEHTREVAKLVAALAPYAAPMNTDPYYFQVAIWSEILAALVEALGSAEAMLELFGLSAGDLADPVVQAQLAEAIARDPAAVTAWSVLDWLIFEEDEVFADMLESTTEDDFGDDADLEES